VKNQNKIIVDFVVILNPNLNSKKLWQEKTKGKIKNC
jgi:hypothetical protein